ncbi:MAG: HIT domain-containing protein [Pseudomonadota bacterium]
MEKIWAPWRGEYIQNSLKQNPDECLFCELLKQKPSKENLVIHNSKDGLVVLNKYPYNSGHIMVVPKKHADSFDKLNDEEYKSLSNLLKLSVKVIYNVYEPQGCNVGMNLGRAAGAGIASHIHYHVVPRWNGDMNFMPVISEVKIISEHLLTAYEKIAKGFLEVQK